LELQKDNKGQIERKKNLYFILKFNLGKWLVGSTKLKNKRNTFDLKHEYFSSVFFRKSFFQVHVHKPAMQFQKDNDITNH